MLTQPSPPRLATWGKKVHVAITAFVATLNAASRRSRKDSNPYYRIGSAAGEGLLMKSSGLTNGAGVLTLVKLATVPISLTVPGPGVPRLSYDPCSDRFSIAVSIY